MNISNEKFYVGLDVGKDEVVAAVSGCKPAVFPHSAKGLRSLVTWVRKTAGDEVLLHVCMEATGVYSRSVALCLLSHSHLEVSIVNPAQIAAFAKAQLRRSKTDRLDAEIIRQFAVSQSPRSWQPESKTQRRLYQLICQRDYLSELLLQLGNRNHSLSYDPDLPPEVRHSQKSLGRSYQRQIAKLETAIEQLCAEDPSLAHEIALLTTIPGVAFQTAVHLLAYAGQKLITHDRKQLTAHAGLAPAHRQSGTSLHTKSHIAKQGDARLRKILYMPAVCGISHNPKLKALYQRLLTNGKPKKLALTACMRKLLLISQAIVKTKKTFNPNLKPLT